MIQRATANMSAVFEDKDGRFCRVKDGEGIWTQPVSHSVIYMHLNWKSGSYGWPWTRPKKSLELMI